MSLLCQLFGHRITGYPGNGTDYGRVVEKSTDGIGREHWELKVKCARCKKEFHAGSFHGPIQHAAPPQREWQGLTDEEIIITTVPIDIRRGGWVLDVSRAIEAKLKEKNT